MDKQYASFRVGIIFVFGIFNYVMSYYDRTFMLITLACYTLGLWLIYLIPYKGTEASEDG